MKENLISGFPTVQAMHYFVKETLKVACKLRVYYQEATFGNHYNIQQF